MKDKVLALLNSSILTAYGEYSYEPVSLEKAKQIVREYQSDGKIVHSAIGHQSTASLLTTLLEFPVTVSREAFEQDSDDTSLVFKLRRRGPEEKILTSAEIEETGYEFGLLVRIR